MDKEMNKNITDKIVKLFIESGLSIDEVSIYLEKCRISILNEMLKDENNPFYVIKKDGKVQKFNENKLYASIGGASDDVHEPLNDGDIKNIVSNIKLKMKEKKQKILSTYEIRNIITDVLKEMGFFVVSKNYSEYEKE